MNKNDILTLFCHEIAEYLKIDKSQRYKIFATFYCWHYRNYSEVDCRVEEIKTVLVQKNICSNTTSLINTHFSYEEVIQIYEVMFKYVLNTGKYKNAPSLLSRLEEELVLEDNDSNTIKAKYIDTIYFKNSSIMDYAQAVISFLMISYSNDYTLDENELAQCKELFSSILKKSDTFPIRSFDFVHALKYTQVPITTLRNLRNELIDAASSDGCIENDEVLVLKKITSLIGVNNQTKSDIKRIEPFCALAVLMSDGELSSSEKNWFLKKYNQDTIINSIEDVFWLFSILISNEKILKENQSFISKIWNSNKPFFDMANGLYLTFFKNFEKGKRSTFNILSKFMLRESSLNFKLTIDKLNRGDVVKEEILLSLNLIFNQNYGVELINKYLCLENSKALFDSIQMEYSPLVYFSIVNALFSDGRMNVREYEVLWNNFESMKIDSAKFADVIYDYSLLKSREFIFDDYFTYLRKNQP